jgi:Flp pilus assembly protein TadG
VRSRFCRDKRGSFAVMTALLLPVLFGFVGIAMEIGAWYAERRAMQGAADAAAFSAAVAYTAGSLWKTEALGVAAANGFTNGAASVTVTANMPPASGYYTDTSKFSAVEVIITKQVKPTISAFVGLVSGPTIPARAVAALDIAKSDCALALNPTASGAITINGGVTMAMPNCGIGDNSKSGSAFDVKGTSASVTAGSISVVGGESVSGSPGINPTPQTGQAPIANPYANLSVPSFTDPKGCKGVNVKKGTTTIDPGVYCGDISITGGGTLVLNPGVYIIDGGSLTANNGSLTGTGVTIIFTSSTGVDKIGTVNIAGDVTVQLTADTSGPLPGFVFFQDPRAGSAKSPPDASISGTSTSYIDGAVYFPSVQLSFSGNSKGGSSGTGCTQLIASSIQFSGNVAITDSGCKADGLKTIGQTRLVE